MYVYILESYMGILESEIIYLRSNIPFKVHVE